MDDDELRFGPFCLDLAQRRLSRDGVAVQLGGRAMEILRVLALAKGAVVTKDELMTSVWPGQIVEENAIQVHISSLRKVLGEDSPGSSYLITAPGRGYRFIPPPPTGERAGPIQAREESEKPSIAVLPFINMSADPEQEYFADGIAEDIITSLARSKWFFVIARNSSFAYKGRSMDVRQVGRELGVRYVLEGSVRKSGQRLRITGQLIETENGRHVWAEKYDGMLADVFDLQDRITEKVAGAIEPNLRAFEVERSRKKPTSSLIAYDHVLRALPNISLVTSRENLFDAITQLRQAVQLDPDYVHAKALLAITIATSRGQGWSTEEDEQEGLACAERVIASQSNDPDTLGIAGMAFALLGQRIDEALPVTERAYAINPNSFLAASSSAWVNLYAENPATSLERFQRSLQLNPIDPLSGFSHSGASQALFALGRYEEGAATASRALAASPGLLVGYRALIVNLVELGRLSEAREAMVALLKFSPTMSQRTLPSRGVFGPNLWDRYFANLCAAGLPP